MWVSTINHDKHLQFLAEVRTGDVIDMAESRGNPFNLFQWYAKVFKMFSIGEQFATLDQSLPMRQRLVTRIVLWLAP